MFADLVSLRFHFRFGRVAARARAFNVDLNLFDEFYLSDRPGGGAGLTATVPHMGTCN